MLARKPPILMRVALANKMARIVWALLLVALDRMSRRAEALTAYHEARAALGSRLGVEPGRELQALHRDLLRAVPVSVSYPGGTVAVGGLTSPPTSS